MRLLKQWLQLSSSFLKVLYPERTHLKLPISKVMNMNLSNMEGQDFSKKPEIWLSLILIRERYQSMTALRLMERPI